MDICADQCLEVSNRETAIVAWLWYSIGALHDDRKKMAASFVRYAEKLGPSFVDMV
jgi:hypothetical protein